LRRQEVLQQAALLQEVVPQVVSLKPAQQVSQGPAVSLQLAQQAQQEPLAFQAWKE
jgi:hypothetical protein